MTAPRGTSTWTPVTARRGRNGWPPPRPWHWPPCSPTGRQDRAAFARQPTAAGHSPTSAAAPAAGTAPRRAPAGHASLPIAAARVRYTRRCERRRAPARDRADRPPPRPRCDRRGRPARHLRAGRFGQDRHGGGRGRCCPPARLRGVLGVATYGSAGPAGMGAAAAGRGRAGRAGRRPAQGQRGPAGTRQRRPLPGRRISPADRGGRHRSRRAGCGRDALGGRRPLRRGRDGADRHGGRAAGSGAGAAADGPERSGARRGAGRPRRGGRPRGLDGVPGDAGGGPGADPVVYLALRVTSTARFLDVDTNLVRLLEEAADRADSDGTRARVLAKLARELLGDASAAARRRALADEALHLARRAADPGTLAVVLDARLHALWDPAGAEDRLAAGSEIIDLARAAGDGPRERQGLFWRFVALMELGRVAEAESALAAFQREAAAAGDGEAEVMVTARHAMLAVLHGRFDRAVELIKEVAVLARRAGMADAEALTGSLAWSVAVERSTGTAEQSALMDLFTGGQAGPQTLAGTPGWAAQPGVSSPGEAAVKYLLAVASRQPGHLFEATAARMLVWLGRDAEAAAELERLLPRALASSGPRWLGAAADLAAVAAAAGNAGAAAQLYDALAPYRGRLVVWAGANTATGPVSHYLGLLAASFGRTAEAIRHFEEAAGQEAQIGALPFLAHTLTGLADALASRDDAGDAAQASQHRRRAREIAQRLGMTGLLERLVPPADEWTLTRDGDDWLLEAGEEHARLRDGRGLHYLRALLAAPGQEIRALDLVAGGAGLVSSGMGTVLDAAARDAYRRRLDALTARLDSADRAGDLQAAERLEAERQALLGELRKAAGLGGRDRAVAPEAERARVNVTRTLRATIERLAVSAPRVAAHLRTSIRTGGACRYEPGPGGPAHWHV